MRRILDFWRAPRPFPFVAARPGRRTAMLVACALASAPFALAGSGVPPGLDTTRADLTAAERARVDAVTRPTADFSAPEPYERMQGGAGTSRKIVNRDAFSHFSANMSFEQQATFNLGNALGAWIGGLTIAAGLGYRSPLWVGAAMTVGAVVVVAFAALAVRRRSRRLSEGVGENSGETLPVQ